MQRHRKKKGSILFDSILIGFSIVILGLVLMFTYLWIDRTETATAGILNSTYFEQGKEALLIFDQSMILIVFGLFATVIISAFFIQSHPVFFIISLIVLTIVVGFSAIPSNIMEEFIQNPELTATANNFPYTVTIMRNWPIIVLMFSAIAIIVLHMRKSGGLVQE